MLGGRIGWGCWEGLGIEIVVAMGRGEVVEDVVGIVAFVMDKKVTVVVVALHMEIVVVAVA